MPFYHISCKYVHLPPPPRAASMVIGCVTWHQAMDGCYHYIHTVAIWNHFAPLSHSVATLNFALRFVSCGTSGERGERATIGCVIHGETKRHTSRGGEPSMTATCYKAHCQGKQKGRQNCPQKGKTAMDELFLS